MRKLAAVFVTITALILVLGMENAEAKVVFQDLKGRTVSLEKPATRLVIDDGRAILALSFLSDDPVSLVAAWPHDIDRLGRELYAAYRQKFPEIETLPQTASNVQDMDVEKVLAAKPDVVLVSTQSSISPEQLQLLERAGIPVVFIDFVSDPLVNTDRSLDVVGQVIGRQTEARKVIDLRSNARSMIEARVASRPDVSRPSILLEPHASIQEQCCNSPGRLGIGKFLEFAGARNIGDVLGNRPSGKLAMEYIVTANPEIYVATGGEYMKSRAGLLVGPDFSQERTAATLADLLARPGFSALTLPPQSVHGISQQLFNSPLDVLALQLLAKWSHPDLFGDLDVEATRRALNGMMAVPLVGSYWTQ